MFRLLFFSFMLLSLSSCTDDNNTATTNLVHETATVRLNLVKMSGQIRNSETTGAEMAWQEYYILGPEMQFTKVRERDGQTLKSEGTFDIVMINSDKYLQFTHDSDGELVGNCTGDTVELLMYTTSDSVQSSWQSCDGPGLYYTFE